MTDIDGAFTLCAARVDSLLLSCVGYKPLRLPAPSTDEPSILFMEPAVTELFGVVVYAGENPADRIIRKVIRNKRLNDPERYEAYRYEAYDKMLFTVDTAFAKTVDRAEGDSSGMSMRAFLDKQHLFLMETLSEKRRRKGRSSEKVLGTKVSGMQNPMFVFLLSQMQEGSLYDDKLTLLDVSYVSPLVSGATSRYFFSLEDTIVRPGSVDTTFVISFHPAKGRNFDGLQGLLYVNTHRWALESATAVPADTNSLMGIEIRHKYQRIGDRWFPEQVHTDLVLYGVAVQAGDKQAAVIGMGKRYLSNISFVSEEIEKIHSPYAVEMAPLAIKKGRERVDEMRPIPLTNKDVETYRVIDSIGEKINLDRKVKLAGILFSGKIPLKYVALDMNKLLAYNLFSGYNPTLDLETSDLLSPHFSVGGFGAYGLKDHLWKYGGRLRVNLFSPYEWTMEAAYRYGLTEPGKSMLNGFKKPGFLTADALREYMVRSYNRTEEFALGTSFRALRWCSVKTRFRHQWVHTLSDYRYLSLHENVTLSHADFQYSLVEAGVRFAFRERLLQEPSGVLSVKNLFPVLEMWYRKGVRGFLDGAYDFHRLEARLSYAYAYPWIGKTSVSIRGGMASGDLPRDQLFAGDGNGFAYSLYLPETFSTMRPGEFFSDRYVALFLSHDFKNLFFGKGFLRPQPALFFHALWGSLSSSEPHSVPLAAPREGFMECGLLLNNLLGTFPGIGVGAFYRLGSYAFDTWQDNLTIKITLTLFQN
ncbi:MAG: hypothetical protein CSA04_01620 [Bacteroidetes bacterium]|nr:MAG: hypothetical protein CSA04_01620 [Bacteroidota bacterium]